MTAGWLEVGDGVLVRRYAELDLSVGLLVGETSCLVIDTRGDPEQGAELAAAVRAVTPLPPSVLITHAHFDHCLGTAAFLPAPVYGHPACRDELAAGGDRQHAEARQWACAQGRPDPPVARPVPPDRTVRGTVEIDLGRRRIVLTTPGRGHTGHDVAAFVPDARVLFAGDLVEQGAPPAFEDAYPLDWPGTVTALLELGAETIVPGHGEPVGAAFVADQRDELAALARLCRHVGAGELEPAAALARSPYDPATTSAALRAAGA